MPHRPLLYYHSPLYIKALPLSLSVPYVTSFDKSLSHFDFRPLLLRLRELLYIYKPGYVLHSYATDKPLILSQHDFSLIPYLFESLFSTAPIICIPFRAPCALSFPFAHILRTPFASLTLFLYPSLRTTCPRCGHVHLPVFRLPPQKQPPAFVSLSL